MHVWPLLVVSEHDPEILYAVRVALASERLFHDSRLALLNLHDATLNRVGHLDIPQSDLEHGEG